MADRIITYRYAKTNYDNFKKKQIPDTLQCMTKDKVIEYIHINETLLSSYTNNRLVPHVKVVGFNNGTSDCGVLVYIDLSQLPLNVDKTYKILFGTGTGEIYGFMVYQNEALATLPTSTGANYQLGLTVNSPILSNNTVNFFLEPYTYNWNNQTVQNVTCLSKFASKIILTETTNTFIDITLNRKQPLTGFLTLKLYCRNVKPFGWNYYFRNKYSLLNNTQAVGFLYQFDNYQPLHLPHTTENTTYFNPVTTHEINNVNRNFVTNKIILGDTDYTPKQKINNTTNYSNPCLKLFSFLLDGVSNIEIEKMSINVTIPNNDYYCIAEFARNSTEINILNRLPQPSSYGVNDGFVDNKESTSIWLRKNEDNTISIWLVSTLLYFGPYYAVKSCEIYRVNNGTIINNFLKIYGGQVETGSSAYNTWNHGRLSSGLNTIEIYPLPQNYTNNNTYFEGFKNPIAPVL